MQAVGIQTALKTIIFWFGIPRFGTVKNSWKKNGMLLREMLCVCLLANPSYSLKGYFTAVCFIQWSVHFPIKSSYTLFSHDNTLLNNVI